MRVSKLSGLVFAAFLAGCVKTTDNFTTMSSVIFSLEVNRSYIVLIDAYEGVKKLSALVGFSGNYGHIEVVRNGRAYGCRPPRCSEISFSVLEQMFSGHKFEIREVSLDGNAENAIGWFKNNLEGKTYDLYNRNCTDAVVKMYEKSGTSRRVHPVNVGSNYNSNARLRRFMVQNNYPKPERLELYFPDQFRRVGKFITRGRF